MIPYIRLRFACDLLYVRVLYIRVLYMLKQCYTAVGLYKVETVTILFINLMMMLTRKHEQEVICTERVFKPEVCDITYKDAV